MLFIESKSIKWRARKRKKYSKVTFLIIITHVDAIFSTVVRRNFD